MAFRTAEYGYERNSNAISSQSLLYQIDWRDKDRSESERSQMKSIKVFTGEVVRPETLHATNETSSAKTSLPLIAGMTLIMSGVGLGVFLGFQGQNGVFDFIWKILFPTICFALFFGFIRAKK